MPILLNLLRVCVCGLDQEGVVLVAAGWLLDNSLADKQVSQRALGQDSLLLSSDEAVGCSTPPTIVFQYEYFNAVGICFVTSEGLKMRSK